MKIELDIDRKMAMAMKSERGMERMGRSKMNRDVGIWK